MNNQNCIELHEDVKGNEGDADSLAKRAEQELRYAGGALQQAGALFAAIEKAILDGGNKDLALLLAQIGIETTSFQAERAESEAEYFSGVADA